MSWRTPLQIAAAFGLLAVIAFLVWRQRIELQPTALQPTAQQLEISTHNSPSASGELLLAETERQFLWECEHHGNLLGQVGFSRISAALKNQNANEFSKLLTGEFQASVPDDNLELRRHDESLWLTRAKNTEKAPREMRLAEFTEWILAIRSKLLELKQPPRFELISFSPVSRENLHGEWKGHARLRMTGVAEGQKPRDIAARFDFRTKAPTRELLKDGAWFAACHVTQVDILETTHTLMREVTSERGFDTKSLFDNWKQPKGERLVTTGGVYLCDYDRDGYTDVLLTSENTPHSTQFYRGRPEGRFEDVTYKIGLPDIPYARYVAVIDIDGDGWEDLVFVGQAVFRNRSGKIFQNVTAASNIMSLIAAKGPGGLTGVTVADYDRDGLVDLYVTRGDDQQFKKGSWIDGKSGHSLGNQLLRNRGEGLFEDVTVTSGTSGSQRSVFTASWFDANDDSWPDVYLIHEFGAGVLLVNRQDGTFEERQIAEDSEDFGSMGLATGDIDNDGQIDIYVNNMYSKAGNRVMDHLSTEHYDAKTLWKLRRMVAGSQLHLNSGNLSFKPMVDRAEIANVGWGWGAALVDLNNDGWLDIHATCGFMSYDRGKPDG